MNAKAKALAIFERRKHASQLIDDSISRYATGYGQCTWITGKNDNKLCVKGGEVVVPKKRRADKDQITLEGKTNSVAGKTQGRLTDYRSQKPKPKPDRSKYWKPTSQLDKEISSRIGATDRESIDGFKKVLDTVEDAEKAKVDEYNSRFNQILTTLAHSQNQGAGLVSSAKRGDLDFGQMAGGDELLDRLKRDLPGVFEPGREEDQIAEILKGGRQTKRTRDELIDEAEEQWNNFKSEDWGDWNPDEFEDDPFAARLDHFLIERFQEWKESDHPRDNKGRFKQKHESDTYKKNITGAESKEKEKYHDVINRFFDIKPTTKLSDIAKKVGDAEKSVENNIKSDPSLSRQFRHDFSDLKEVASSLDSMIRQNSMTADGTNKEFVKKINSIKGQNAVGLIAELAYQRFHQNTMLRQSEWNVIEDFKGYQKDWNRVHKQTPYQPPQEPQAAPQQAPPQQPQESKPTKGEKIQIKPEFRDSGETGQGYEVHEVKGDRVDIKFTGGNMNIPPIQTVPMHMIEAAPQESKPTMQGGLFGDGKYQPKKYDKSDVEDLGIIPRDDDKPTQTSLFSTYMDLIYHKKMFEKTSGECPQGVQDEIERYATQLGLFGDSSKNTGSGTTQARLFDGKSGTQKRLKSGEKGDWKTINGTHVFMTGGKITKGPSHMVGKKPSEIDDSSPGKVDSVPSKKKSKSKDEKRKIARSFHQKAMKEQGKNEIDQINDDWDKLSQSDEYLKAVEQVRKNPRGKMMEDKDAEAALEWLKKPENMDSDIEPPDSEYGKEFQKMVAEQMAVNGDAESIPASHAKKFGIELDRLGNLKKNAEDAKTQLKNKIVDDIKKPKGDIEKQGMVWKENRQGLYAWFDGDKQVSGAYPDYGEHEYAWEVNAMDTKAGVNKSSESEKKFEEANQKEFEESDSQWGHLSDEQIEEMIARDSSGSYQEGEFDQMGGRRSGKAMNNQGNREAQESARKAQRYLDERKSRRGENHVEIEGGKIANPIDGRAKSFSIKRAGKDGQITDDKFEIGEKVDVYLNKDKSTRGEIAYIHKDGQISVDFDGKRLKYDAGSIYHEGKLKPKDPEPVEQPKAKMGEVIDKVNEKNAPEGGEFGIKDQVFNGETHGGHKAVMDIAKQVNEGKISLQDFKDQHDFYAANKQGFMDDLSKRHNAKQLKALASHFDPFNYKNNTKAQNAKAVYQGLMQHAFHVSDSGVFSYSHDFNSKEDSHAKAIAAHVDKITEDDLKAAADRHTQYKANREAKEAEHKKSLENPETLSQFKTYVKEHGAEKLTREQRATMDRLSAEKTRGERQAKADEKKTVSAIDTTAESPGEFSLSTNYHSKRGQDIYTASPGNRVDRDKYNEMNQKAKQLGGWYYKAFKGTPGGFHFPDEEKRDKFLKLFGGEDADNSANIEAKEAEKSEAKQNKFHQLADSIQAKADADLNADRKTNTARRANMAAGIEARAEGQKAKANTLRNIAAASEKGEIDHLKGISAGTHIDTLESMLNRASWDHVRAEHSDKRHDEQEQIRLSGDATQHIHHAKYPHPYHQHTDLQKAAELIKGKRGLTYERRRLESAAKQLRERGGHGQIKNKDTQEAITAALKKIKTMPGRDAKWLAESLSDAGAQQSRLKAMGIHDEHELREALREYVPMKGKQAAADPVKKAERALIGKKLPGFFPTPPSVVEQMLEHAGIEDHHDVLEPSAGAGHIMDTIRDNHPKAKLKGLEYNRTMGEVLGAKDHNVEFGDFKEHKGQYDRIVMNPPFEKNQDAEHVQHAFNQLKPGGRVVAVVSGGGGRKREEFDRWIESQGGTVEDLPQGSFAGSDAFRQTGVNSRIVILDKGSTERNSVFSSQLDEVIRMKVEEKRQQFAIAK